MHLKKHAGSTEKSLAAIASAASTRQTLERIADTRPGHQPGPAPARHRRRRHDLPDHRPDRFVHRRQPGTDRSGPRAADRDRWRPAPRWIGGAISAPRRDRPGRDGGRAPGPRPGPQPRPGVEGPPRPAPRPGRPGRPVRRGGPDLRPAPAPRRRAGLRAGHPAGPPAVLRHEAGERADAGGAAGRARIARRRPAPVPVDLRGDLPDGGLRPRPRGDPSRPEAVERDGRQLRRGPGDGLGPGQGAPQGRPARARAEGAAGQ